MTDDDDSTNEDDSKEAWKAIWILAAIVAICALVALIAINFPFVD